MICNKYSLNMLQNRTVQIMKSIEGKIKKEHFQEETWSGMY